MVDDLERGETGSTTLPYLTRATQVPRRREREAVREPRRSDAEKVSDISKSYASQHVLGTEGWPHADSENSPK